MKILPKLALLGICCLPLTSCATTHLVNWGTDQPSIYAEPEGEFSRGILKPFVTVVGVPVAVVWDVVTFPFQVLFGTPPYGEKYMTAEQVDDV